jgi:hypothetical protein
MYEHYHQPLISRSAFIVRVIKCSIISLFLLAVTIFIGAATYHYSEGYSWVDATLNAVSIMTGLGIVGNLQNPPAKVFTSFYAIFSTIAFFLVLGFLFSPLIHRFMHRFHLDIDKKTSL